MKLILLYWADCRRNYTRFRFRMKWKYRFWSESFWYTCCYILCRQCKLVSKYSCLPLVKGDPKAPFSIATTPRCRGEHYSIPWIAPLYPWSLPYNAECLAKRNQVPFFEFGMTRPEIEPRSPGTLANTLFIWPMAWGKIFILLLTTCQLVEVRELLSLYVYIYIFCVVSLEFFFFTHGPIKYK